MNTEIEPRRAIVTGADSGIGRAAAVALAAAGLDVGITWHSDSEGAEATAAEVRSHGARAVLAQLDVSDIPACGDVIDALADELGGLDVFVNNAGTGTNTPFLEITLEEWNRVFDTDLTGAFICLQRAARRMVAARRGGRLIAVTSVHAHQPMVGMSAYDAAKHGLDGLMKNLALELGSAGISAVSVAPGEIATPMTDQTDTDAFAEDRPGIPLGRPGDAREVGALIAFLASPEAAYISGTSIAIDGGMLQMGPQAGAAVQSHDWRSV
ncbi:MULTISPECIES: SDR family oxidoreductase [unclassified Microbacterium]|uniref:SDR family oxidoreductase n=1 Tax=unclassified Microbacterium TaxID=2609290 RepID=UPI000EAA46C0|nr:MULTISPECIES: SDR family oxidoreductase [unclassified Microbacterium]MBT2483477.1 SDR family oxidoreductase [Microbacterium sp. ISL-108]RKN66496.1 SDR family oxidoreductase [Microbacterium sp. CGR2]